MAPVLWVLLGYLVLLLQVLWRSLRMLLSRLLQMLSIMLASQSLLLPLLPPLLMILALTCLVLLWMVLHPPRMLRLLLGIILFCILVMSTLWLLGQSLASQRSVHLMIITVMLLLSNLTNMTIMPLVFSSTHDLVDMVEPITYRMACTIPHWQQAMEEEIAALHDQGTWSLVASLNNCNIVGCKWVYKVKKNPDGTISRYKVRFVAPGFSQRQGLGFQETFSPVVRHTTVRLVLALAASNCWKLRQLDVKIVFLHGDLQEEVYMQQPKGFVDPLFPSHVCKLHKSLYGLKQAPRAWNDKFTSFLPTLGFASNHCDPSLFVRIQSASIVILLLYVDDIILTGSDELALQFVIDELGSVFELKDMGPLTYFLGLQIHYDASGMFITQEKMPRIFFIELVWHRASLALLHVFLMFILALPTDGIPLADPITYRSLVGALQYLTFTRPDIAYAVNTACQFMKSPTDVHFGLVKRILRYLQGSLHRGLHYSAGPLRLIAYSDADWVVILAPGGPLLGSLFSWQSKRQSAVSRSSTEAEYRALANTAADVYWIHQVLCVLQVPLCSPPLLHCDNLSAIALSSNDVFHSRIKHLDTDFHFVREKVQQKDLQLQFISTSDQVADLLTKGLLPGVFSQYCSNLNLSSRLVQIAEG
ncbi:hypothetical protein Dimus_038604 [Dionaea muscipula]